jgi:hypothetical protein
MFAPRAREIVRYLRVESGLRYVADVHGWDLTPEELASVITFHAIRAACQPLLIVYNGHGGTDGWYYAKWHGRKWLSFDYSLLASILKKRRGPTLVINDTCRASSLASLLDWGICSPKPVGLISATSPKGVAYGSLSPDVLEKWRLRKSYDPKRRVRHGRVSLERRYGAMLDRYFFPAEEP